MSRRRTFARTRTYPDFGLTTLPDATLFQGFSIVIIALRHGDIVKSNIPGLNSAKFHLPLFLDRMIDQRIQWELQGPSFVLKINVSSHTLNMLWIIFKGILLKVLILHLLFNNLLIDSNNVIVEQSSPGNWYPPDRHKYQSNFNFLQSFYLLINLIYFRYVLDDNPQWELLWSK